MIAEAQLHDAAEFLAKNLMEYIWSYACEYDLEVDGIATPGNWQPYADTKEGWWQARMVIQEMRRIGFKLEVWASSIGNFHVRFTEQPQYWEIGITFEVAITLAAARVLGWKGE